jgi:hypothetical protein
MLVALDLVVDDHAKADGHVGGGETSKGDQGLLADADPWRVADAKEDWLGDVRIDGEGWMRDLRGRPSWWAWGGAQQRKTLRDGERGEERGEERLWNDLRGSMQLRNQN